MKFQAVYESALARLHEADKESDYEKTLGTLDKAAMKKFLKKADLSYKSIDYNTFGDILIKTDDPQKVHDILNGVGQLERFTITLSTKDGEVKIKSEEKEEEGII